MDLGEASDSASLGQDMNYVDGEEYLSDQKDSQPGGAEEGTDSDTSEVFFIDDAADGAFSAEELPADGIAEEDDALVSEPEELIEDPDGDQAMDLISKEFEVSTYGPLKSPIIVEDSSMDAGQKVTYSCVWFGFYPQSEVPMSSGLYNELAVLDGWDENRDITYNGQKYRRMQRKDATYYGSGLNGYYNWGDDGESWHYFVYEPIKWRVLSIEGTTALLLADLVLDDQKYNTILRSITWANCTMRSWLNNTFLNCAFSSSENSAVLNSSLENKNNLYKGTNGGDNTEDKVFLLSEEDVYVENEGCSFESQKAAAYGFASYYATNDEARKCKSSTYAKAMGARNDTRSDYTGNWWRLRSPGYDANRAADVNYFGDLHDRGNEVGCGDLGVRPALNLNLASDSWTYAGTVCSDDTDDSVDEIPFTIPMENCTIEQIGNETYNGNEHKPTVTVTYQGQMLAAEHNYTVSYSSNVNVGTATVTVTGKGYYKGEKTAQFTINTLPLADCTISQIGDVTYNGSAQTPSVEVTYQGQILKEGSDYTITYSSHINVGTATVTVTGLGDLIGEKTAQFAIVSPPADSAPSASVQTPVNIAPSAAAPAESITISKKVSGLKGTAAKTAVTATWKAFKQSKNTKAIKKIEMQVSTDSTFTENVTSKVVGKKKTKVTVKGLNSKTTYYVRVRYLDGNGGVSKWSKVKKIKTK
ncbi:MAG: hypothetical protein HUJ76_09210 [Parasporobacterium sp.]|nr:hypothetical protein [Parasporobacterium sp.]